MKKLFLLFGIAAALFSCKKENTADPVLPAEKKLTKTVFVYDSAPAGTTTITYDAQGRMSTYSTDDHTDHFTYVSATSISIIQRKNSDNSLHQTKECTLDAAGRMTKIVFKNPAGTQTYVYDFVYNAEGYLVKRTGSNGGSTTEYNLTITSGNVSGYTIVNDGVVSYVGEFSCDVTKTNKTASVNGGVWPSATWFGKRSQNLITEVKAKNPTGVLTHHQQSTYVLDAEGYPLSVTTNYPLTGKQGTDTYTYE